MRICILCNDSNIELARENSKVIFSPIEEKKDLHPMIKKIKESITPDYLSIPLSESGEKPITHWFCFMNVDDEGYQRILDNSKYSTIEESSPKEFLEKWNLKIIK